MFFKLSNLEKMTVLMPFKAYNSFCLVLLQWPYQRVTVALTLTSSNLSFLGRDNLTFKIFRLSKKTQTGKVAI